jgi:hypothetical protein
MPRFTIRDMLWLTVVVAMGVGWWRDRHARFEPVWKWWYEHVEREHSTNPNDSKRLIERDGPPISN